MATPQTNTTGNIVLDNPGISATILAIVTLAAFGGALYNVATSHSGGHGSDSHKAAPAEKPQH